MQSRPRPTALLLPPALVQESTLISSAALPARAPRLPPTALFPGQVSVATLPLLSPFACQSSRLTTVPLMTLSALLFHRTPSLALLATLATTFMHTTTLVSKEGSSQPDALLTVRAKTYARHVQPEHS